MPSNCYRASFTLVRRTTLGEAVHDLDVLLDLLRIHAPSLLPMEYQLRRTVEPDAVPAKTIPGSHVLRQKAKS